MLSCLCLQSFILIQLNFPYSQSVSLSKKEYCEIVEEQTLQKLFLFRKPTSASRTSDISKLPCIYYGAKLVIFVFFYHKLGIYVHYIHTQKYLWALLTEML